MAHKFNGTWNHYQIGDRGVPNPPNQGLDFVLAIDNAGMVNPLISTVDGKNVQSGRATDRKIDILTTDGYRYVGHFLKTLLGSGGEVFHVIAGRFVGPHEAAPKGKARGKKTAADGQDEGTWVIVK